MLVNNKIAISSISIRNKYIICLLPSIIIIGQFFYIFDLSIANIFVATVIFVKLLLDRHQKVDVFSVFFLFVLIIAFVSLFLNSNSNEYMSLFLSMSTGILVMLFIASLPEEGIRFFLIGILLLTAIILVVGTIEIFTGNYFVNSGNIFAFMINMYGLHYPVATFANTNDLAQFIIFSLPLSIGFIYSSRKSYSRFLVFILSIVSLFIIINTSSKLATLCVLILFSTLLFFFLSSKKRTFPIYILKAVIILFILGAILTYLFNISIPILEKLDDIFTVNRSAGYYTARDEIYMKLLQDSKLHLLLGGGLGRSYTVSQAGPHNFFLFLLCDFGLIITAFFVYLLMKMLFNFIKNTQKNICNIALNKMAIMLMLTFPLFSSISSGNEQRKVVWMMLGLFIAIYRINIGEKSTILKDVPPYCIAAGNPTKVVKKIEPQGCNEKYED